VLSFTGYAHKRVHMKQKEDLVYVLTWHSPASVYQAPSRWGLAWTPQVSIQQLRFPPADSTDTQKGDFTIIHRNWVYVVLSMNIW